MEGGIAEVWQVWGDRYHKLVKVGRIKLALNHVGAQRKEEKHTRPVPELVVHETGGTRMIPSMVVARRRTMSEKTIRKAMDQDYARMKRGRGWRHPRRGRKDNDEDERGRTKNVFHQGR